MTGVLQFLKEWSLLECLIVMFLGYAALVYYTEMDDDAASEPPEEVVDIVSVGNSTRRIKD